MLSQVLVLLRGPFYERATLQKDALLSHRTTTNAVFDGPNFRRAPPPFLSLSLTSLMPFAEFFLRGTAEGLSTASSRDGRRGRWEVCPRSARSRGVTLCFARPPAAHAGNRSPARAAPSSRAPTLARGLSSYFAGNWFGLIYQAICLIFCLPAVVLAPSTRILPLQRVPWHAAQS